MTGVDYVFVAVVGARFLLPLLIPRYPLPAVLGCLLLDGVDQTIFQLFGYDPPGYQGYDKAMDVYYLAIAYLATLRNWVNLPAYGVGRFLYFYRLVGVVAFELSQVRALLLIFPNTFEYFFIAYESWRTRWQTARVTLRHWVITAAMIWIFVKLPQEYWLHVAQLDVTDTLRDYSWAWPLLISPDPPVGGRPVVRRPSPAAGARLAATAGGRPPARGDRHRRRAGGLARRVGIGAVVGDRREGRPGGPDLDRLRADAARDPREQRAAVRRDRRLRGAERRDHAGCRPARPGHRVRGARLPGAAAGRRRHRGRGAAVRRARTPARGTPCSSWR